mgnify:CR=1 FL=1
MQKAASLPIGWMPCILHGLYNLFKAAIGLCDEKQAKVVDDKAAGSGSPATMRITKILETPQLFKTELRWTPSPGML